MTTSDALSAVSAAGASGPLEAIGDLSGAQSALAAGFPDPADLARLANAFFAAGPGAVEGVLPGNIPAGVPDVSSVVPTAGVLPVTPGIPTSPSAGAVGAIAPPLGSVSGITLPSAAAPRVPSAAELKSLPGTLAAAGTAAGGPAATIPGAVGSAIPVPSTPVSLPSPGFAAATSGADVSGGLPFSFLQEARGLVPGSGAGVAAPAGFVPGAGSLPSVAAGHVPAAAGLSHATVPQSAGVPSPGVRGAEEFGFLREAKPLDPFGVVPTLSPVGNAAAYPAAAELSSVPFDVEAIRRDFPILQERVNGRQLIWLDNAATTHKPQSVIDRLSYFYAHENSNIHRAAHTLAARATDAYEGAREKVRRFINASSAKEIIFVRGCTEGVNLVAQSWGRRNINKDDEIIVTLLEHHANIVPWQLLCAEKGAKLRVVPVDNDGQILLDEYEKLLNPRTKLVSISQVSNALGTITPVHEVVAAAHRHGVRVLVDGAQSVSHIKTDVQALDADFYVFSGHKMFAPTGIGVVYGKSEVLEQTPPWQGGGNMIADVTFEKTLYQGPPNRFEAGTGNIADAVGLGAAIDYLDRVGMANITRYEHELLEYGTAALSRIPGLHLIGTAKEKAGVMSFVLDGFRTEDVGAALNQEGIAVRSGHHCAQPILRRFGVESTVRPSLAFYNTCQEIDALVAAIWNLKSGRRTMV